MYTFLLSPADKIATKLSDTLTSAMDAFLDSWLKEDWREMCWSFFNISTALIMRNITIHSQNFGFLDTLWQGYSIGGQLAQSGPEATQSGPTGINISRLYWADKTAGK